MVRVCGRGRGVRRQQCSVTKKKGSRPWNLKKGQPPPPFATTLRIESEIYGGQTVRQTNRFGSQGSAGEQAAGRPAIIGPGLIREFQRQNWSPTRRSAKQTDWLAAGPTMTPRK